MVFADEVAECAEEGAGLGWFECHCLMMWTLLVCRGEGIVDWRDRGVENVVVW